MAAPSVLLGPGADPGDYPFVGPGDGSYGASLGFTVAHPQGFCVAFDDPVFAVNPTWTRLDDPTGPYQVTGYTIDRGRPDEFGRNGTGGATVTIVDTSGAFDPTNATGTFYGKLEPLKQAAIGLYNPVAGTWSTVFRGFVSDWDYVVHPTERFLMVTVTLVDAMDVLAAAEMAPDGTFGDGVDNGNITFLADASTNAVQTRINRVLDQVGWPVGTGLREVFSANVKLQETVYSPRASALSVIQDAADAEFPSVSQIYAAKDGKVTFHGRLARFRPTEEQYHITTWHVGDKIAVAADATVCPVLKPLQFVRNKENLFTSAISTPQEIDDADIAAQYVTDGARAAAVGLRTWSAENLLTAGGAGTTAAVETKKFATYYRDNYKTAKTRVRQLSFKAATSSGARASTSWELVCGIDISDRIHLHTTHAGGGGFDDYFFVEGVHYDIRPQNATHHEVSVTVDVSPAEYYATEPA